MGSATDVYGLDVHLMQDTAEVDPLLNRSTKLTGRAAYV